MARPSSDGFSDDDLRSLKEKLDKIFADAAKPSPPGGGTEGATGVTGATGATRVAKDPVDLWERHDLPRIKEPLPQPRLTSNQMKALAKVGDRIEFALTDPDTKEVQYVGGTVFSLKGGKLYAYLDKEIRSGYGSSWNSGALGFKFDEVLAPLGLTGNHRRCWEMDSRTEITALTPKPVPVSEAIDEEMLLLVEELSKQLNKSLDPAFPIKLTKEAEAARNELLQSIASLNKQIDAFEDHCDTVLDRDKEVRAQTNIIQEMTKKVLDQSTKLTKMNGFTAPGMPSHLKPVSLEDLHKALGEEVQVSAKAMEDKAEQKRQMHESLRAEANIGDRVRLIVLDGDTERLVSGTVVSKSPGSLQFYLDQPLTCHNGAKSWSAEKTNPALSPTLKELGLSPDAQNCWGMDPTTSIASIRKVSTDLKIGDRVRLNIRGAKEELHFGTVIQTTNHGRRETIFYLDEKLRNGDSASWDGGHISNLNLTLSELGLPVHAPNCWTQDQSTTIISVEAPITGAKPDLTSKEENIEHMKSKNAVAMAEDTDVFDKTKNGVFTTADGTVKYYKNGLLHRDDGPAETRNNGTEIYYKNGKLHREGGLPAMVGAEGVRKYAVNGKYHRVGGQPAIERMTSTYRQEWWDKNTGISHAVKKDGTVEYYAPNCFDKDEARYSRLDGPAIVRPNGIQEYWIEGAKYYGRNEWEKALLLMGSAKDLQNKTLEATDMDMDKTEELPETVRETKGKKKSMKDKKNFTEMMKSNAIDAGYRVGATQMTAAARSAIVTIMRNKGHDNATISGFMAFLDTDFGAALISVGIGAILEYLPKVNENEKVMRLAEEMRIGGLATAGNAFVGEAMKTVVPALMGVINNLPELNSDEEESNIRVEETVSKKKDKKLAEHLEEEEAETTVEKKTKTA